MARYSLYDIIKDRLTPYQKRVLENQIKYNELVGRERKHEEDNL